MPPKPNPGSSRVREVPVRLDSRHVLGGYLDRNVGLARLQAREGGRQVRVGPVDDLVQVRNPRTPIVRIFPNSQVIVPLPLHKLEGPGTRPHWIEAEAGARLTYGIS